MPFKSARGRNPAFSEPMPAVMFVGFVFDLDSRRKTSKSKSNTTFHVPIGYSHFHILTFRTGVIYVASQIYHLYQSRTIFSVSGGSSTGIGSKMCLRGNYSVFCYFGSSNSDSRRGIGHHRRLCHISPTSRGLMTPLLNLKKIKENLCLWQCVHASFDLCNLTGIDEFPEPISYRRWISINRCDKFSRLFLSISKSREDLLTERHT